ncbi:hypothetical protein UY3_06610 [Chelonia mydas]|uniref:Uncharacterized protein n=1 Tax=Chelonia mydas TaxID=8469 RepID=M7BEB0_CHEMY|nr:hypothetical protein UY3_06610 [Chelonia mydas]
MSVFTPESDARMHVCARSQRARGWGRRQILIERSKATVSFGCHLLLPSSNIGLLPTPQSITKDRVHEWLEFVALWLPSGSGFLNCFVYFWTNRNFRHKFQKIGHKLCGPCSRDTWEQDVHRMVTISAVVERSSSQPVLPLDRSCSGSSTSILLPREAQTSL